MTDYFDELDTLSPTNRERNLFANVPNFLQSAIQRIPALAQHLDGIDPQAITDRQAMRQLPVLRKTELMNYQSNYPPFGGFVDVASMQGSRVFMSPGPVWEPQVSGVDPWQAARALHAAGIRRGDLVHNAFSYHLTPGGFILDEGARALGCCVFPAGVGNTDAQVEALDHLQATAYIGTPDYLQTLLDRAVELNLTLPALTRALVSGGALFPAMRERYLEAGVHVYQAYATADLGVIAYETSTKDGVHSGLVVNENLILEIVRPGSNEPVATGDVGEIVVTRLHPDYPLVRFATGDLSRELEGSSPCGRTQKRIAGWMGRADQRTKVRGMFVDPVQVEAIRQAHPEITQARLVIERVNDRDTMTLQVWLASDVDNAPTDDHAIEHTLQTVTKLKGSVCFMKRKAPNDGVVIEDQRDYDT